MKLLLTIITFLFLQSNLPAADTKHQLIMKKVSTVFTNYFNSLKSNNYNNFRKNISNNFFNNGGGEKNWKYKIGVYSKSYKNVKLVNFKYFFALKTPNLVWIKPIKDYGGVTNSKSTGGWYILKIDKEGLWKIDSFDDDFDPSIIELTKKDFAIY